MDAVQPKVRVAFLGCGGMMGAHAGRLKAHPGVEIAWSDAKIPGTPLSVCMARAESAAQTCARAPR